MQDDLCSTLLCLQYLAFMLLQRPIFLIYMYIISWGGFQVHIYIYRMTQKFNWYLFGNLLPQMTFYYSGKRKEPQQGLGSRIGLFSLHFSLNVRWTFTVNPIVRALSNGWVKTLNVWESWVRLWCILLVIMAKCYNNTHTASGGVRHIMSRQDFFVGAYKNC